MLTFNVWSYAIDVLSAVFWDAQNCGHQKIENDGGKNDSPQTVVVYGGTENVPKKKNSWIIFHLIPSSCKIVFHLENKNVFFF